MQRRGSGILLHITSLPSPYGIGDLGPEAYRFVDFLVETKQSFWQVLPLNPTGTTYGNSPYSSPSTFAGNTLFISPDLLLKDGFISEDEIRTNYEFSDDVVDYAGATEYKNSLISTAYKKFRKSPENLIGYEFNIFCEKNSRWLDDYALFVVLKERFKGRVWSDWPREYRDRNKQVLEKVKSEMNYEVGLVKFSQFLFYRQWYSIKDYCRDNHILVIGDLPIYPNYDSADVWTNPHLFKLGDNKKPLFVAGVPPDYFSSTGQLWGNPVYDWETLMDKGYKWWIDRIEHNLAISDILRIDHFRGLVSYWEVPSGEKTAIGGNWVDVPVDDFFKTLNRHFTNLPVIAEDLGIITPDVREVMERFNFPGMKVLIFAFGDDFPTGDYLPHNYTGNCVVYTGTHDNNTVRGWYRQEADKLQKERLSKYSGIDIHEENVSLELIRLAMRSVSNTAIIPMQDILSLDENAKMNQPSTSKGNWLWRIGVEHIDMDLKEKLREITEIYDRDS